MVNVKHVRKSKINTETSRSYTLSADWFYTATFVQAIGLQADNKPVSGLCFVRGLQATSSRSIPRPSFQKHTSGSFLSWKPTRGDDLVINDNASIPDRIGKHKGSGQEADHEVVGKMLIHKACIPHNATYRRLVDSISESHIDFAPWVEDFQQIPWQGLDSDGMVLGTLWVAS